MLSLLLAPAGRPVVAAGYLALLAYLTGSGHDHADSDCIKLLDRLKGVREVSKPLLGVLKCSLIWCVVP